MKTPIIETIIKSTELLKDCKFHIEAISNEESIIKLNDYFETNSIETIILVSIFQLSAENNRIDREDIAKFLGCNPILFFKYEENFDVLFKRGFLETPTRYGASRFTRKIQYQISDQLHYSIIDNNKPESLEEVKKTDPIELLTDLIRIIEEREENNVDTQLLLNVFHNYLREYSNIPFFPAISSLNLQPTEKLCWLLLIERNLTGQTTMAIDTMREMVFSKDADKINFSNSLYAKSNSLITEKWIDFSSGGYFSDARVQLTPKSKEFLIPLGINLRMDEVKNNSQLLMPENIYRKRLFYNSSESEQLSAVSKSLNIRNHSKIKKRLTSQGLRTGICTLLYGAPGTGKTESVYQIARETGRPLWKVDLTELKSMWFGESQKKVKALFENYKELSKEEKRTPILLLNEADAILGTRHATATGGSETANNAIQNIFLDCLEDFEGILFATTNLEKSLDPAFERRFLFKVKINRPEQLAQQKIWKAMLKELTPIQTKTLSESYDLSGGEIENVLRKLAMMRVLEEEIDVFKTVKTLCENEQLGINGKLALIGYYK